MASIANMVLSAGFVGLVVSGISYIGLTAEARNNARLKEQVNRGVELGQKGDFKGAQSALAAVVERNPTNVDALFNLGIALSATGELDAAERAFARVVELDPTDFDAVAEQAALLAQKGEPKRALDLLEKIPVGSGHLEARIIQDPRFDNLEEEARYVAIKTKHGHPPPPSQPPPPTEEAPAAP